MLGALRVDPTPGCEEALQWCRLLATGKVQMPHADALHPKV